MSQPSTDVPDRRDGRVYVTSPDLDLAVRVALATGRPLLLRGDPGAGKSSFAAYLARRWDWRYYEYVVTSRSQARDLLWTFDHVRRLADAEARRDTDLDDVNYVEPGVLWWAFARESALRRGAPTDQPQRAAIEPDSTTNMTRDADHAVVLIDEIDKADPDLPNGLLVPLGSNEFTVTETGITVRKAPPGTAEGPTSARTLVIITTNEERELPRAFLRRCVVAWLPLPDSAQLVEVARSHIEGYEGRFTGSDRRLAIALADIVTELGKEATAQGVRPPSTAEFLDALRACRSLGIGPESHEWQRLQALTLTKAPPEH